VQLNVKHVWYDTSGHFPSYEGQCQRLQYILFVYNTSQFQFRTRQQTTTPPWTSSSNLLKRTSHTVPYNIRLRNILFGTINRRLPPLTPPTSSHLVLRSQRPLFSELSAPPPPLITKESPKAKYTSFYGQPTHADSQWHSRSDQKSLKRQAESYLSHA